MSVDCVRVCGNVCCVAAVVKDSVFSPGVLKYVVSLCKGCNGCCVFCLYCMGSMSVSSCRCCVCVLCASCGSQCYILHDLQFVNAGCCCSPSETYGRKWGDYNLQIFTELTVPPQAAGIVGTF